MKMWIKPKKIYKIVKNQTNTKKYLKNVHREYTKNVKKITWKFHTRKTEQKTTTTTTWENQIEINEMKKTRFKRFPLQSFS